MTSLGMKAMKSPYAQQEHSNYYGNNGGHYYGNNGNGGNQYANVKTKKRY